MDDLDLGQTIRGFAAGQKLFARYTLKAVLGRGGMGIVWRAFDEQLERDVALKFLPELIIHDRAVLDELKAETRKSLQLTHHNIVRIHDFAQDSQAACISMEYVDGPTLSSLRIDRPHKVFEVDELLPLIEQACDALSYAHGKARIVHRDLKPANLMLNAKGELKVADFGISRSLTDSVSMATMGRGTSGTLPYMSPQQLDGARTSHLDDIYSLGATIYDLLTSKPPFYSGNVDRQIHEKVPPLMATRREELEIAGQPIPEQWERTVAACLSKEPAQRPQSAEEIAKRLGSPGSWSNAASVADKKVAAAGGLHRQRKLVLSAGLALLFLCVAFLTWQITRRSSRPSPATDVQKQPTIAAVKPAEPTPAPPTPANQATGALLVQTEPPGATVKLGEQTRQSPASFDEVAPGTHTVNITADGYESVEHVVEVKGGALANPGLFTLKRSETAFASAERDYEAAMELSYGFNRRQVDPREANRVLKRAAAAGLPEAKARLAFETNKGGVDLPKDPARARELAQEALADGIASRAETSAAAQNSLGTLYREGVGVPKTPAKAAELYEKAAARGYVVAQHNLGFLYQYGNGVPKNPKKAADLYQKASDYGMTLSQCNLGFFYEHGTGVPKDLKKAVELYQKAADQGSPLGQFNLAILYRTGRGIPKDLKKAAELFQTSADQGHSDSFNNLGDCYQHGYGVPKDPAKAAELYEQAGEMGNPMGWNNLGILYAKGVGVRKDAKRAAELFQKAIDQGNTVARENLKALRHNQRR